MSTDETPEVTTVEIPKGAVVLGLKVEVAGVVGQGTSPFPVEQNEALG